jgi:hypothetical protein
VIRISTVVALALVAGAGCYAGTGYQSGGYTGVQMQTGYVSSDPVAYSTPPPQEVDVDVYYEPRPGYVYVNGRYNWLGNQWVWQQGTWEVERPGHVYVQGYWNNNRWYNGGWERHRPGYVYTGGYWDRGNRGHRWVQGNWEPERRDHVFVRGTWQNNGGVRTYNRGRWEGRARANPGGGSTVRDHRRR